MIFSYQFIKKIIRRFKSFYTKIFYGLSYGTYKACLTNRSFDSMSFILIWIIRKSSEIYPNLNLKDSKVLELGTGQFLSHPIAFKLLGAEFITTIDINKQFNNKAAYYSLLNNTMARKVYSEYSFKEDVSICLESFANKLKSSKKINLPFIEYLAPYDILSCPIENEFDIVFSYTVLEHIPKNNIKEFIKSSLNTIKKDGFFIHYIDLEDHLSSKNPFAFLDSKNWNDEKTKKRGNRLRMRHWDMILKDCEISDFKLIPLNYRLSQNKLQNNDDYFCGIILVGKR